MKLIKKLSFIASSAVLCLSASQAGAQNQALTVDELVNLVNEGRLLQTEAQREREQQFMQNVNQRQQMVTELEAEIVRLEAVSQQLEDTYNQNELIKAERFQTLQERLGDLDELFGTISSTVGDTLGIFEGSLISAQYPGREQFLEDLAEILGRDSALPSISELETMWGYILQEITESAKIVNFNATIAAADGTSETRQAVRVGAFNIMTDGQYVRYDSTTKRLSILAAQPTDYTSTAAALQNSSSGFTKVGIDPTGAQGGSYLAALIGYPTLQERIEQGRTIGYIILAVGAFGLLFAVERIITLTLISAKVRSQLKNINAPKKNNPLGRVLMVYNNEKDVDIETLELKLGEAILKETPKLERFLSLLKIIATVAPLGGLLGTVTGMITVFQAITVFGTGDPQVMASGISGALVTTVEGLVVAIPMVLLHTFVKSRSDRIIHVLEEQTTGMIARKAEGSA